MGVIPTIMYQNSITLVNTQRKETNKRHDYWKGEAELLFVSKGVRYKIHRSQ